MSRKRSVYPRNLIQTQKTPGCDDLFFENFEKMSKISKNFEKCRKFRKMSKISKNVENFEKCRKFANFVK